MSKLYIHILSSDGKISLFHENYSVDYLVKLEKEYNEHLNRQLVSIYICGYIDSTSKAPSIYENTNE